MNNRNTIQDELNELNSGLNPNSNNPPYSVPEGYFEGLATSVLAKIRGEVPVSASEEIAQLSPLLAGISRQLPYSIPDDYFQTNIEGLKAFTSEEESLVLSFIDKEMPYEVPAGYFANVSEQIAEKISSRSEKVVPMMKRKWMRLAVAAVFAGIITISGITYFNSRGSHSGPTGDPVTVELKKASNEELNAFLKTTVVDVNDDKSQATAKNTSPKTERKNLFNDVSDKELEAFLDQVPTDDDDVDIN